MSGASRIEQIPAARIRPEEGLERKRDRSGHHELCQSVEKFGVLTPITVRRAPDGSGDFILIKGQGRTLACRLLGIKTIPAVVVDEDFDQTDKVQQFLVENVARLRMRPVDRALLIAHARSDGEETADVARRFGITASTVRRLEAQLDGASSGEIAALHRGDVNLAAHAVIARRVPTAERSQVIRAVSGMSIRSNELETLLVAIGWTKLVNLGVQHRSHRIALLTWCCAELAKLPKAAPKDRIREIAAKLPLALDASAAKDQAV